MAKATSKFDIILVFLIMTTIWCRTAISKALPNLTFIDMETFFHPLGSLQVQNMYFLTLSAKPSKHISWEAVKYYVTDFFLP